MQCVKKTERSMPAWNKGDCGVWQTNTMPYPVQSVPASKATKMQGGGGDGGGAEGFGNEVPFWC